MNNLKESRKMKNTMRYFGMAALVVAMATMTGCMKEDIEENGIIGDVTLTANVKLDTGNGSKQLGANGVKTFAEGEQIAVVYTNTNGQTVKATSVALQDGDITNNGKSASFTVTLTDPRTGTVRYVYPASMVNESGVETSIANQNGILDSLSKLYDYASGEGSFTGSSLPNVTLTNQFAIGKITMKDFAGSSELSGITGMTVTDGTNTYTITPATTPMTWPIYVAMKPVSSQTITVTATGSTYSYTKTVTDKTLMAGNMYTLTVKMSRIVDLASVGGNFTAQDGDILTGTMASAHQISIADGATVTLDNVSINADGAWSGMSKDGIQCGNSGNITINLVGTNTVRGENYHAGIFVPSGSTLTIQGSGTLNAIGGGATAIGGAGIGGQYTSNCGNIVIAGGTINATGGSNAAGIGMGYCNKYARTCGYITISGGVVTATGGAGGVGIGSIDYCSCGIITISGGTVTATGGSSSAGIGSGNNASCDGITINGGTVTATGGTWGAGIGSGANGASCGDINITSGVISVTATKGSSAPNSIGAGNGGTCGTVTIADGANVTQN